MSFETNFPAHKMWARRYSEEEKNNHPVLSSLKYMKVIDLSTHKTSVSKADIDLFYNRLNNFDYRFMLFKNYYKSYTNNLIRFSPKAESKDFNLAMVQLVLSNDSLKPIKPFDVLIFQLKWKVKLTSKVYIWFANRNKKR